MCDYQTVKKGKLKLIHSLMTPMCLREKKDTLHKDARSVFALFSKPQSPKILSTKSFCHRKSKKWAFLLWNPLSCLYKCWNFGYDTISDLWKISVSVSSLPWDILAVPNDYMQDSWTYSFTIWMSQLGYLNPQLIIIAISCTDWERSLN